MATASTVACLSTQLFPRPQPIPLWLIAVVSLATWLLIWTLMSRQFVRVDDNGFTYRRFLLAKQVKWQDITVVEADWSTHFEGLASSYGVSAFMGYLKFHGAGNKVLLKAKVNCGSVEMRHAMQEFIAHKLGTRIVHS